MSGDHESWRAERGSPFEIREVQVNDQARNNTEEQSLNADASSNVSELSSIEERRHQGVSSNAAVRQLMISSEQRRQERRKWNPTLVNDGSSRWSAPQPVSLTSPPEGDTGDEESQEAVLEVYSEEENSNLNGSSSTSRATPEVVGESRDREDDAAGQERSQSLPPDPDQSGPPLSSDDGPFTHVGSHDSKYRTYHCLVDRTQDDRSLEIHLYSSKRPHMRAFQLSWIAFFVAFFTWFAITPLLSEVQRSLNLTRTEIWISSTFGMAGSAIVRVFSGPLCDKYGARWIMAATLVISAVPTGLMGSVQTATGLYILRLVIGVAGAAFVTSQYWTSSMFTVEVNGTASALVAGWGNLGGGVTQIVMGSLLFPLFKLFYGGKGYSGWANTEESEEPDRAADLAWRTIMVIPAIFCFQVAYDVVKYADDCPKGNYIKRSRHGVIPNVSAFRSLQRATMDYNTWLLCVHYGCCFGVEITMINAAALYFTDEFQQSTESAAAIASIFGWMNLFARGVGGFCSDMVNAVYGMRGRLWVHVLFLVLDGCMVVAFAYTGTLAGAILVMIIFSIFVQAAEGSTYSIVPYVQPSVTGSTAGVVGACGNVGGVMFSLLFASYNYRQAFTLMGIVVISSSVLTAFISMQGHSRLLFGRDSDEVMSRRTNHNESFGNVPQVTAFIERNEADVLDDSQQESRASSKNNSENKSTFSGDNDLDH